MKTQNKKMTKQKKSKGKLEGILSIIFSAIANILSAIANVSVLLFSSAFFIVLTRRFTDELITLPSVFIFGWCTGIIFILLKVISINWFPIPISNKQKKTK